jgi:hypothetical protein
MDEKENVVLGQLPWAIISSYLASSTNLAKSHKIVDHCYFGYITQN